MEGHAWAVPVVLLHPGGRADVVIEVRDPSATVAELTAALQAFVASGDDPGAVAIGGRCPGAAELVGDAGLRAAVTVSLGGQATDPWPEAAQPSAAELQVTGGLDAGRRWPLARGLQVVHLSPGDQRVVETDDRGGARVQRLPAADAERDGVPVRVRHDPAGDAPSGLADRRPGPGGTVSFERPPRPAPPKPPPAVPAPDTTAPLPVVAAPMGLAALAPLAASGVVVAVTGDLRFALFATLGPIAAGLAAVERRWRGRRDRRAAARRTAVGLAEFEERLRGLVEAEVAGRHDRWPDPAEVARRAQVPSTRLWERRPGSDDFLHLRVGRGAVPWNPPVTDPHRLERAASAVLEQVAGTLPDAPVLVALAGGGTVGVVGPRPVALAVARCLVVQAAVLHGPADLRVAVCADGEAAADWTWTAWLPHTADPAGGPRLLAASTVDAGVLTGELLRRGSGAADPHPATLLVVDGAAATAGRGSAARAALGAGAGSVAGIVVAADADGLPAICRYVVRAGGDGRAVVEEPAAGERLEAVRVDGMGTATARACALALARFDDPEEPSPAASLPLRARLLPALGFDRPTPEAVAGRWRASGGRCAVPIGVGPHGIVALDLVDDGPHGLVAGTTGSGKSELLRTLVAGLAATVDPDHLSFVLIDFKGGSAFDECRRLPHTVGLVTDLDPGEAARALRCLEAELRHRELVLRRAGVTDLGAYLAAGSPHGPLPRLAVVVDEFATLKSELPGFVDALVGIAQRGRSLGMHLVLATQRPGGAVSHDIRANAGFTVALRTADATDSVDVIGSGDAATIPRSVPGRALVRLGPGEVAVVQTAFASAPRPRAGAGGPRVVVSPGAFGPAPPPAVGSGAAAPGPADTDLRSLVAAVRAAFEASGRPRPRRPWLPPLPATIALDAVTSPDGHAPPGELPPEVAFAVADDPDRQRQFVTGWRPREGNLLLHGVVGAGTTTAVASALLAVARATSPQRCHLYVVDLGAGALAALAGLPHCGAVIGATEAERQRRLVRRLLEELRRRRATPSSSGGDRPPAVVVAIDGFPALASAWGDGPGAEVLDGLLRVMADGPEVGLHFVVTGDRAASLPAAVVALTRQRLLFRLADPHDHGVAGPVGHALSGLPPGRAVDAHAGLLVQVAVPGRPLDQVVADVAARWPPAGPGRASPVGVLGEVVPVAAVAGHTRHETGAWVVAVGHRDHDLGVAVLEVRPGEHVLVAGPARSGKSTALSALAASVDGPSVLVAGPRSGLAGWTRGPSFGAADTRSAVAAARQLAATRGRCLLLVDDADDVGDVGRHLEDVLTSAPAGLVVAASGRPEALRGAYTHWTRTLRQSRLGLLLRPTPELDGDLLGVRLPRHPPAPMVAGRGYLVQDGDVELVQVATTGCAGRG